MSKILFSIFLITIASFSYAQKGDIKIGVGGSLDIPASKSFKHNSKTGYGGYLKGLFGIGNSNQATFTANYSSFPQKQIISGYTNTVSIISLLPGYRYSINGFYIETQAGLSIFQDKSNTPSGSTNHITSKFTWAGGLGYEIHNIDIGVRYQSSASYGGWGSFWDIHIGYNFSLKKKK
jgi:hypothetical protein